MNFTHLSFCNDFFPFSQQISSIDEYNGTEQLGSKYKSFNPRKRRSVEEYYGVPELGSTYNDKAFNGRRRSRSYVDQCNTTQ